MEAAAFLNVGESSELLLLLLLLLALLLLPLLEELDSTVLEDIPGAI